MRAKVVARCCIMIISNDDGCMVGKHNSNKIKKQHCAESVIRVVVVERYCERQSATKEAFYSSR